MSVRELTFSSVASTNHADRHILAKVTRRLIPFLFTCFVLNYIDRINVGFAKLHFQDSLGFSDAVFGLGLSLFFVGYLLFEVPSNLLLARFGARKTISRIMVLWVLVSIATMFVTTSTQFYIGRFLLGVAEAGFAPGIVLYLYYWYDTRQRARVTSMFFLALPIAGIIGKSYLRLDHERLERRAGPRRLAMAVPSRGVAVRADRRRRILLSNR